MKLLLFGGTIEGRLLAEWLQENHFAFLLSVATEYGECLLPPNIPHQVGRMGEEEMTALMREGGFTHVLDATHPYAAVVTETIRKAAKTANLPLYRLIREEGETEGMLLAESTRKAAELLSSMEGNILLTTGAKELDAYTADGVRQRCFPRVLPSLESLERALALGFVPKQVICMQGPFSRELNAALIRQFDIKILVTKLTGAAGGFQEKVEAARETGCTVLGIGRPLAEEGFCLEELKKILEEARG